MTAGSAAAEGLAACPGAAAIDALPPGATIPHPRPFACGLRVPAESVSRTVAHVSNVHFVAWLDRAAELHGDAVGWSRDRMLRSGRMWFVARHEIDYSAEAHPGDDLVVLTWVRDMRRVKSWRDTVIVRPADRTVVCRAASLWVHVDLDRRRPVPVDADLARAFDPLETPRLAP